MSKHPRTTDEEKKEYNRLRSKARFDIPLGTRLLPTGQYEFEVNKQLLIEIAEAVVEDEMLDPFFRGKGKSKVPRMVKLQAVAAKADFDKVVFHMGEIMKIAHSEMAVNE